MKNLTLIFILICNLIANCCYAEGNIYIFVSFSMPNASIKNWLNTGSYIKASVVIRGLVNNSFKETIKKMTALTHDNQGGVQLDPTLFQKFNITEVPAVVVTTTSNCAANQSCKESYDVIYGNVTLAYALNKIANQHDDVSAIAENALNELRGHHEEVF